MKATLKDLEQELWLRMRNANKILWETKDSTKISIKEMSTKHIINCINMIKGDPFVVNDIGPGDGPDDLI